MDDFVYTLGETVRFFKDVGSVYIEASLRLIDSDGGVGLGLTFGGHFSNTIGLGFMNKFKGVGDGNFTEPGTSWLGDENSINGWSAAISKDKFLVFLFCKERGEFGLKSMSVLLSKCCLSE